ncbi:flippase-like domain-containing protein [Solirubrobacter phytolaccae]|uniref:Flippase-like domain-containing protein n=1 Tax=Solirubrobacter phytolaccae TaxID=1404360 RepID=A0A9X3NC66_9ACTN|nr:lysylphosphatidylglycerol synthase transmembrane domain-containing protein [Solirubrobacter phytolaccae]MDA0182394.1 flippase-like domain-containing protein [Solirubrobacter phytolaccae]
MTHVSRWLGVVVSAIAVGAVVYWMTHQPAPELPSTASGFAWLGLALALSLAALGLRGWRWHRIMAVAQIDHTRTDALALTAVASMGNNVLPARGGEVLRIALLGQRSTSRRRDILGTVVAERLVDAVVLAAVFAVLSLGLADSPAGAGTAALVGAAIVAGFGALAVYVYLRRAGRFDRFAEIVRPLGRSLRLFAHRSGVPIVGWSLAIWAAEAAILLAIARSVGLTIMPQDAALIVAFAALATGIPAAPAAAGTYDGAMVLGLKAAGIAGSAASGILILSRVIVFGPPTLIGLVVLVVRYGGLRAGYKTSRSLPVSTS